MRNLKELGVAVGKVLEIAKRDGVILDNGAVAAIKANPGLLGLMTLKMVAPKEAVHLPQIYSCGSLAASEPIFLVEFPFPTRYRPAQAAEALAKLKLQPVSEKDVETFYRHSLLLPNQTIVNPVRIDGSMVRIITARSGKRLITKRPWGDEWDDRTLYLAKAA